MNSIRKINLTSPSLTGFSIFWVLLGLFLMLPSFKASYHNYKFLRSLSLDAKRALVTGPDFYQFLMFCDRIIPKGEEVKWVFPEGRWLGNSEYHFYRAYYFLYPRNYRENANYIIVYGREGYKSPPGYSLFAKYSEYGYILFNKSGSRKLK